MIDLTKLFELAGLVRQMYKLGNESLYVFILAPTYPGCNALRSTFPFDAGTLMMRANILIDFVNGSHPEEALSIVKGKHALSVLAASDYVMSGDMYNALLSNLATAADVLNVAPHNLIVRCP